MNARKVANHLTGNFIDELEALIAEPLEKSVKDVRESGEDFTTETVLLAEALDLIAATATKAAAQARSLQKELSH